MSNGKLIKKEKKKEWLVSLTIEIPKEEFEKRVDKLSRKYAKTIQLPGFRKGKVPPSVLMKKYGESIKDEAFNELLDETYKNTLKEEKINPIAVGNITDIDMELLKYTAEIEVMPDIDVEKYKDLEVEYTPFNYSEEYLNSEIEYLRKRSGEYVPVERGANERDLLVIDMTAEDEKGKNIKDFTMENFAITLGDGYIFKELEDVLIGKKIGNSVSVDVTIPKDYKSEGLAGKTAKFNITIKEVKTLLLPNLDDDFAKDMGYENLDDLKKSIEDNLRKRADEDEEVEKENRLLRKIADENSFELPKSLIEEEARSLTKYFHRKEKDQAKLAEFEKMYIPMAEMYLKNDIIIEKVMEKEKIKAEENEILAEIEEYAKKTKMDLEKAKELLEKDGSIESIKSKIVRKKVMDFLFEHNKFVPIKEDSSKENAEETVNDENKSEGENNIHDKTVKKEKEKKDV